MDCEYVLVEALAQKLAEQCDGLVLPHLIYFHPGATDIGRGTVYMSMTDGGAYLRAVAQSLLNQGFRRQVYLTAHGPAYQTVMPMVTQFLDETKVPLFHGDLMVLMKDAKVEFGGMEAFDEMIYGAYQFLGRLGDVPLGLGSNPAVIEGEASDHGHKLPDSLYRELCPKSGGYYTAWKYGNVHEHENKHCPETPEELEELAARGLGHLDRLVEGLEFQKKLDALRELDEFHQKEIMPRYGKWLVRNRLPEPEV